MEIDHQNKCNQCLKQFPSDSKALKMPHCAHNICESCFNQIKTSNQKMLQCEFCGYVIDDWKENNFLVNINITNQLNKTNNAKVGEQQRRRGSNQPCEEQDLLLSNSDDDLFEFNQIGDVQLAGQNRQCTKHSKEFQLICLTDLCLVCVECGLFDGHKGHQLIKMSEFTVDFHKKYQEMQAVRQKKYELDKKVKKGEKNIQIMEQVNAKKEDLIAQIKGAIQSLIDRLRELERSACEQVVSNFEAIARQAHDLVSQKGKLEEQFNRWYSGCQDLFNRVQEGEQSTVDDQIRILYQELNSVQDGAQIVNRINTNYHVLGKRVENLISSVEVTFSNQADLLVNNFVKVSRSSEEIKRESFLSMFEGFEVSSHKHLIEEYDDYMDNSFIIDQSDLSLVMDSQGKAKGNRSKQMLHEMSAIGKPKPKKPHEKQMRLSSKLRSPARNIPLSPRQTQLQEFKLQRSKSNGNLFSQTLLENSAFQKKQKGRMLRTDKQIGVERIPEVIVSDFLKSDLKEVLDLSNCGLGDSKIEELLRKVRKHRKMKSLKLSENEMTDKGFRSIIEHISGTSNLNLSYNKLTEESLSLVLDNREKLTSLRIINISFNNLNEKRAKTRIQALKNMGIIINF